MTARIMRKTKPRKETKEKMRPYTRDAFHNLLKRAATTPAPRHAPK
jgi:hypothetical protein